MQATNLIPLNKLCASYQVEISFFDELHEVGLIEITIIEQQPYLHQDSITDIEKIMRIHHDLQLNVEAIDVVFNLLNKVTILENELNTTRNRLRIYENF